MTPRKSAAAFLENYKAEVEAAMGPDAAMKEALLRDFDVGVEELELKRPRRSRARRALDAVILGVVAVPILVGSLLEIVLAERARSRARDRHSAKRKNAK